MEEPDTERESVPTSSSSVNVAAATTSNHPSVSSSSGPSPSQVHEENDGNYENDYVHHQPNDDYGHRRRRSYHVNLSISDGSTTASQIRDDVWSCLTMLVTFWLFGRFSYSTNAYAWPFLQAKHTLLLI